MNSTGSQEKDQAPLFAEVAQHRAAGADNAEKMEWLADVASLLPPGQRERFLLRIASYTQEVNLKDPIFGMLDALGLTVIAYRGLVEQMKALVDEMKAATDEVRAVRGGVREAMEMVENRLKQMIGSSTNDARQLLEDVRSEMLDAVSPERIATSFAEESQRQFGAISQQMIDEQFAQTQQQLVAASEVVAKKLQTWVEANVNDAVERSKTAMDGAVENFKLKLFNQWGIMFWSAIGGGLIAAVALFVSGYLLGRH